MVDIFLNTDDAIGSTDSNLSQATILQGFPFLRRELLLDVDVFASVKKHNVKILEQNENIKRRERA